MERAWRENTNTAAPISRVHTNRERSRFAQIKRRFLQRNGGVQVQNAVSQPKDSPFPRKEVPPSCARDIRDKKEDTSRRIKPTLETISGHTTAPSTAVQYVPTPVLGQSSVDAGRMGWRVGALHIQDGMLDFRA